MQGRSEQPLVLMMDGERECKSLNHRLVAWMFSDCMRNILLGGTPQS